jgi:putative ABC transport system permease protein
VFISFRNFSFPDITAEGSVTLGAAVTAVLLVAGVHPVWATMAAFAAGAIAGAITGVIHTRFGINRLLSGILVMTALFSVNLHIMGKSNVPLMSERTVASLAESWGSRILGVEAVNILGWDVATRDLSVLVLSLLVAISFGTVLYLFFRTNLGTAMQAAGDNDQMIRALGVNVNTMIVLGLALSNGLIAGSGALLTQYQGFADVQMGIGMVVWGLASIIIGEALVGVRQLGYVITGAIMGSVLFRLLVAIALRGGLNPNDLKLITAAFVFAALVLPGLVRKMGQRKAAA